MLKDILNPSENFTFSNLNEVCKLYSALVFPKIRLADVFPIDGSGISNKEYSFALKSHFDFLVTKDRKPLFAVEFDSTWHKNKGQIERDKIKDNLCKHFGLPLLRVDSKTLYSRYRNLDVLTWFIEIWFNRETFYQMQNKGFVHPEEPYYYASIIHMTHRNNVFPLVLSQEAVLKIRKLSEKNRWKDIGPSHYIFKDSFENYYAIAYIRMNDNDCIFINKSMKGQYFPVSVADLLSEIAIFNLYVMIKLTFNKKARVNSVKKLTQALQDYSSRFKVVECVKNFERKIDL